MNFHLAFQSLILFAIASFATKSHCLFQKRDATTRYLILAVSELCIRSTEDPKLSLSPVTHAFPQFGIFNYCMAVKSATFSSK